MLILRMTATASTYAFKRYVWEDFSRRRKENREKTLELEDCEDTKDSYLVGPGEVRQQIEHQEDRQNQLDPEPNIEPEKEEPEPEPVKEPTPPPSPPPKSPTPPPPDPVEPEPKRRPSPERRPASPTRSPSPHFWPDEKPRATPFYLIGSKQLSPREEAQ